MVKQAEKIFKAFAGICVTRVKYMKLTPLWWQYN